MLHIEGMNIRRGIDYRISLPALDLARGEVAAITGPSGCGKSTLLEMIGLILQPDELTAFRLGDDALDIAALLRDDCQGLLADVRARRLGFVLQNGGLLPYLDVRHNIQLPPRMLGLDADSELIEEVIDHLQLRPLLHKKPAQLSIGERQRVSFVRAIAHQPDLLLADEPTAALDPLQARKLFELIIEIVQRFNISALLVTHDWDLVRACAIRTITGTLSRDATGSGAVFHDAN